MANKTNSLAHTKWMCKYHIVFSPKYRRKVIYNQYRESLQDIIRTLCRYKGVEILEGHMMSDHVHLVLSIPPKISVSSFMGYLNLHGNCAEPELLVCFSLDYCRNIYRRHCGDLSVSSCCLSVRKKNDRFSVRGNLHRAKSNSVGNDI